MALLCRTRAANVYSHATLRCLTCKQKHIAEMLATALCLLAVGLLWGVTNPFIRIGSQGIEATIDTGSRWRNFLAELRTLSKVYIIAFALNQCGSLLYVWTLQSANITVAVPVANSLSFAFTAITGYLLGEQLPGKKVIMGTLLICCGSTLMVYDKLQQENISENITFDTNELP